MKNEETPLAVPRGRRRFLGHTALVLFALGGLARVTAATRSFGNPRTLDALLRDLGEGTEALARQLKQDLPAAEQLRLVAILKNRLNGMLLSADVQSLKGRVREWVRDDFLSSRTVNCRGVVIAETEAATLLIARAHV